MLGIWNDRNPSSSLASARRGLSNRSVGKVPIEQTFDGLNCSFAGLFAVEAAVALLHLPCTGLADDAGPSRRGQASHAGATTTCYFGAGTTLYYADDGTGTSILTISDGTHSAQLQLVGTYLNAAFSLLSNGHRGVLISNDIGL